jgi:hypothetical protein
MYSAFFPPLHPGYARPEKCGVQGQGPRPGYGGGHPALILPLHVPPAFLPPENISAKVLTIENDYHKMKKGQ